MEPRSIESLGWPLVGAGLAVLPANAAARETPKSDVASYCVLGLFAHRGMDAAKRLDGPVGKEFFAKKILDASWFFKVNSRRGERANTLASRTTKSEGEDSELQF